LTFAHVLADASAQAILPHFRRAIVVDNKSGPGEFDPVTAADRAAERAIAAAIRKTYPDHGLVGEEYGTRTGVARYRWVVDPIDGTRAFIMGYPLWGTLIGLLDGDQPVLGMMDQPFTRERYWSGPKTSHLRLADGRARKIATRTCPRLDDAILSTTHPDLFAAGAEAEGFARLKARARMTRYGGDCYAYAMLAAGHVDLVAEAGLKPHDIVALVPLIERAGGRVTTWDGGPATEGGRILASGDPRLHDKALKVLAGRG
jgi:myo-inositol-1(or 4)-monophosphatase